MVVISQRNSIGNSLKLIAAIVLVPCLACDYVTRQHRNVPQEEELERYPEFHPFLPGRLTFHGIEHNLDVWYYSFSFQTNYDTPEPFFSEVHQRATAEGWNQVAASALERVYQRVGKYPEGVRHNDVVTLRCTVNPREILFIYDPDILNENDKQEVTAQPD